MAACTAAGWRVLAGVRTPALAWRLDRLAPQATRVEVDLSSRADMADLMRRHQVTTVVNCAAYGVDYSQQDMDTAIAVNVIAPVRLIEAASAAGVADMVHMGTAYEYGPSDVPITEDVPLKPRGVYASTKAAGSILALSRAAGLGLSFSVLRLFTMFGPLEGADKFTPLVVTKLRAGEPVALTAGEQVRDYLYVGDAVRACLMVIAAGGPPQSRVFNVGSGEAMTLKGFGTAIAGAAGGMPELLQWGGRPYRADEVMRLVADCSRLRAAVGWIPATSLEAGLRQTMLAF